MGRSGWAFLIAPMRLKEKTSVSLSLHLVVREYIQCGSLGLEETSHVLDTENVDTLLHELVNEVEVVLQGVLGLLGAGDITTVADDGFNNTAGLLGSVDSKFHLEYCEHSICNSFARPSQAHTFSEAHISMIQ